MRRISCFLMVLCLAIGISGLSTAENKFGIDFSALSDEELSELIELAQNEQTQRGQNSDEPQMVFEQNGVVITFTGKKTFDDILGEKGVRLECIVENNTDTTIFLSPEHIYVNGWKCGDYDCLRIVDKLEPGKKAQCDIAFWISKTGIKSYDEVEEVIMDIEVYTFNFKTLFFFNDLKVPW